MNKFLILFLTLIASNHLNASTKVKPSAGTVALTFDDGPDPRYTPKVLEILAHNNIKATFFIVGKMAKAHPDLVLAIRKAGHTIANHSYTHAFLGRSSPERVTREIRDTNVVLKGITGEEPTCLRPPYGSVNAKVRQLAHQEGLVVVTWDWNSMDYTGESPETEVKSILAHSNAGSVVLMHDANRGGRHTAEALPMVIEGFKKRNIGFDTICD